LDVGVGESLALKAKEEASPANDSGLLPRGAGLPCDTRPPSPDHPLLIVIWFKEPSPDPVYSYDVRGSGVEIGRHWNDGASLGARARFEESTTSSELSQLWIDDLREMDDGLYRCRVDFRQAPTRNVKIKLNVIGKFIKMVTCTQVRTFSIDVYRLRNEVKNTHT